MNRRSLFKLLLGGIAGLFCKRAVGSTIEEVKRLNPRNLAMAANAAQYDQAMEYYRRMRPYFVGLQNQIGDCLICKGGALCISNEGLQQAWERHQLICIPKRIYLASRQLR